MDPTPSTGAETPEVKRAKLLAEYTKSKTVLTLKQHNVTAEISNLDADYQLSLAELNAKG